MSNDPYLHENLYRGKDLAAKIATLPICICGVGALGSILCDTLARQGFKTLKVIDFDRVEVHNLNTQLYGMDDVGQLKVTALQQKIYRATKIQVQTESKKLENNNVAKLLKNYSLIIDCFDNFEARNLLTSYCASGKLDCLHGGMFEGYGEVVWNEVYKVPKNAVGLDVCSYPLARNLATFVVSIMAEELQNFVGTGKKRSHSITLGDFKIKGY